MTQEARKRVHHPQGGRKMTKQSEADATDINKIMDKYVRTGIAPQSGQRYSYGDFSNHVDYHAALNRVRTAETEFMNLPAHVRKFCDNDPGRFLDLVMDAEGRAQLDSLGMVSDFAPEGAPEPAEQKPAEPVPAEGQSENPSG